MAGTKALLGVGSFDGGGGPPNDAALTECRPLPPPPIAAAVTADWVWLLCGDPLACGVAERLTTDAATAAPVALCGGRKPVGDREAKLRCGASEKSDGNGGAERQSGTPYATRAPRRALLRDDLPEPPPPPCPPAVAGLRWW